MPFDRVFHPVVVNNVLYFGSSIDCGVHALDVDSGSAKWSYITDAPIRFAPLLWKNRVYFVSDDGHLYCVDSSDGSLIWKKRGGTTDEMILGNSRMISQWPARGGPVIRDGIVYFTAGIWPSTGIFIHAIDATTGETVWENKNSGKIVMPQPHGGAEAESGVSAQGYLIATEEHLLIPTGRAVPAVFDRETGEFLYFHLQKHGRAGGASVMVSGEVFFNSGILFDTQTGAAQGKIGSGVIAQLGNGFAHATSKGVTACRWLERDQPNQDGEMRRVRTLDPYCRIPEVRNVVSLVGAGSTIVSGGDGVVHLIDATPEFHASEKKNRVAWTGEVDGKAYGLAVSGQKLFVSTDTGAIYCFSRKRPLPSLASKPKTPLDSKSEKRNAQSQRTVKNSEKLKSESALSSTTRNPYGENLDAISAAEVIIASTELAMRGANSGYCYDYACGDGALAYELAKRTNLTIYAEDHDPKKVAEARRKLRAAGLYGSRVTVHLSKRGESPYPKYFANLIVSGRSLREPFDPVDLKDKTAHMLRPFGGQSCFGSPGKMETFTRGPLAGAGEWTHQYGNPANTVCSEDNVHGTLKPLWFRDVGQAIVQRHGRGPSPLFFEGVLYSAGLDTLVAVDAYNGTLMWEYAIPGMLNAYHGDQLMGVSGTNSNYCVGPEGVFLRNETICYHFDRLTGAKLGEFPLPSPPTTRSTTSDLAAKKNHTKAIKRVSSTNSTESKTRPASKATEPAWGYIACSRGVLYGSIANPKHQVTHRYLNRGGDMSKQLTESSTLFAMDAKSGDLLWRYDAEHSIRHNAIAIGKDAVYLIDRPLALFDRKRGRTGVQKLGQLLALDPRTGKTKWKQDKDIFGTLLAVSDDRSALLMGYQPTRFRLESEIGNRIAVHSTNAGERLWAKDAKYFSRPLINQDTIYSQGGAWDLLTGKDLPFEFSRSYGCGILAAGRNMMVFRSATLGYVDFSEEKTVHNFGGMRPGCWINAIPAGGLILVPDGSAGCTCSYQNKTWMALQAQ